MTSNLLGLVDQSQKILVDEVLQKFDQHSELKDLKMTLPVADIDSILKTLDGINLD